MKDTPHEIKNIVSNLSGAFNKTSGVGGILTRLWYSILYDLEMEANLFEYYLAIYVNSENNKPRPKLGTSTSNNVAKHFTKGNLRRELLANPGMTFKSFIRGLRILQVHKVRFIVELHRVKAKTTIHETVITLADCPDTPDDEGSIDTSKLSAYDVVQTLGVDNAFRSNAGVENSVSDDEAPWEPPQVDPNRIIRR